MSTWYPDAIQHPGAPDKGEGYDGRANICGGAVLHSMEGWIASALRRVENAAERVSWHFSIDQQGVVYQHYPVEAVCFHAGDRWANEHYIGVEHEGMVGMPLTPAQLAASVRLVRWLAREFGWVLGVEPFRVPHLHEHNEFFATACPSDRIPWEHYTMTDTPTPPPPSGSVPALLDIRSTADVQRVLDAIATGATIGINNAEQHPIGFDAVGRRVIELHLP